MKKQDTQYRLSKGCLHICLFKQGLKVKQNGTLSQAGNDTFLINQVFYCHHNWDLTFWREFAHEQWIWVTESRVSCATAEVTGWQPHQMSLPAWHFAPSVWVAVRHKTWDQAAVSVITVYSFMCLQARRMKISVCKMGLPSTCIERGRCEVWPVTLPCEVRKRSHEKKKNSCHGNKRFRSLSASENSNKCVRLNCVTEHRETNHRFSCRFFVCLWTFCAKMWQDYILKILMCCYSSVEESHSLGIPVQECLLSISVFALFAHVVFVLWLLIWSLTCCCVESSSVHVTHSAWRTGTCS